MNTQTLRRTKKRAGMILAILTSLTFFLTGYQPGLAAKSLDHSEVRGRLWVTNQSLNDVAVYDAGSGELLKVIPVGSRPIGIVAPPGTGKVYVTNETDNTVSVISTESMAVIRTIPSGAKPHHLVTSLSGDKVYFGEFGTNKVGVIETANDTYYEFVTSPDLTHRSHMVSITNDGKMLLVANSIGDEVVALDAHTGEILWTLPVGSGPSEVLLSKNGKLAYVTLRGEDKLKIIHLKKRTILSEVFVGDQPDTIHILPGNKTIFVALRGTPAQVALVKGKRNLRVDWIDLAGSTTGHNAISKDGRYSYVALEGNIPGVAVVDNFSQEQIATFPYPGGGKPHGIFFEPFESEEDE